MKYFIYICMCAFMLSSCISAELSEPVCKTSKLSINASVPSAVIPFNEIGTVLDFSKTIGKIDDYGDVSITVDSNTLNGDITWASHVTVTIKSLKQPDKYPEIVFTNQNINSDSDEVSLKTLLSSEQLTKYFSHGEIEMTFKFDKGPGNFSSFSHNICTTISVTADRNLL